MSNYPVFAGIARWVLCLGVALAAPTARAQVAEGAPGTDASAFVDLRAGSAVAAGAGGTAERLLARARAQGRMKVMVTIDTDAAPRAPVAGSPVKHTARQVGLAQDRLLAYLGVGAGAADTQNAPESAVEVLRKSELFPWVTLQVDAAGVAKLLAYPDLVRIRESAAEDSPSLAQSIPLINANDVWAKGSTGAGYVVAVIDTGVDDTHPMLAGKVLPDAACFSSNLAGGKITPLCRGGVTTLIGPGSGKPCAATVAGCNHGTHVASIAAGNTTALSGVAKGAKIISVQVGSRESRAAKCANKKAPCVVIDYDDTVLALEYILTLASKYKIAAINMSLGGVKFFAEADVCDIDQFERLAVIDELRSRGVITIAAAGNDGRVGVIKAPACISSVVAVGNSTKQDVLYTGKTGSNHSKLIGLLAPGTAITAAVPVGTVTPPYASLTGTSMATPHVAGAWALLKQAKPTATNDEILDALECTGEPITYAGIPKPRIDVLAAYNVLKGAKSCSFEITVYDSGSAKDDIFVVSIDGKPICETPVGGLSKCGISGVTKGPHKLQLFVKLAPDDLGTYTVQLASGVKFSDNTTSKSGSPPEGVTVVYDIVVPVAPTNAPGPAIDYNVAVQEG